MNYSVWSDTKTAVPGSFVDSYQTAGTGFTKAIAWGDYDNDGDLDIVVGNYNADNPIYKNNGDGTFTDTGETAGTGYTYAIDWGDFDSDGDLDIVAGNSAANNTIYRNNGDGTFTDTGQAAGAGETRAIAWGDFDNDGDLDIVVGNYNESNPIYRNNGDGTFTDTGQTAGAGYTQAIAWGDYDNDGDMDILVGNVNENNPIYRNNGDGTFTDTGETAGAGATYAIAWGDYDNDGDLDIVVGNSSAANPIYRNNGNGTFTDTGQTAGAGNTYSIAWGDYNNDGYLDIVAGNFNGSNPIYRNNGDGTFTDTGQTFGEGDTNAIAWGDFDNDADLDMIEGTDNQTNRIYKSLEADYGNMNTVPAAPSSGLSASYDSVKEIIEFRWDKSTDAETPSAGLCYVINISTDAFYYKYILWDEVIMTNKHTTANFGKYMRGYVSSGTPGFDLKVTIALPPGVTYYWHVHAIDTQMRASDGSAGQSYYFAGPVPCAPSSFTGTAVSTSSIQWNWTDDSTVEDEYRVKSSTGWLLNTLSVNVTYWLENGLSANTSYQRYVEAYNASGSSACAVISKYTLANNNSGLQFTGVAGTSATFTWNVNSNPSWTRWGILRSTDNFVSTNTLTDFASDYTNNSYTDTTLAELTTYWFKVQAFNGDGIGTSFNNIISTEIGYIAPGQVTGFTAGTGAQVELSWIAPGDDDYIGDVTGGWWQIKYSSTTGCTPCSAEYMLVISTDYVHSAHNATITGLKPRTTYYFWICAYDDSMNYSVWSDTKTAVPGSFVPGWNSSEKEDTIIIAWGDYNNDGYLDIAAGNQVQKNRVYKNNGDGTFSSVWQSEDTDDTRGIAWGDYDNDGDLDIAAGNNGQTNRVYRNNEDGTFTTVWISTETESTLSLCWGDYNNDGYADLLMGNGSNNSVYKNNGDGTFSKAWDLGDTDFSYSVCWGDYDNDGDLDIAAGNDYEKNRVYRNNGDGTFTNIWNSSESEATRSISWGDYDNDGDLDLLAGNYDEVNRVYGNNGDGTFTSICTSIETDSTYSVSWGDYDNDGDLDIAVGNYDQQNRIYRNNGAGTFTNIWSSEEAEYTMSVCWGDFDNDEDLDLAAGNFNAQTNRIYESLEADFGNTNTAPASPSSGFSASYNQTDDMIEFRWDKSADNETSQDGLYYAINITTDPFYYKYILWDEVIMGEKHTTANFGKYMHCYISSSTLQPGLNLDAFSLPTGVTYYWHVHAIDSQMRASLSSAGQEFYFSGLSVLTPAVPTGFAGTAQSSDSILWNWADNDDNENGYWLQTSSGGHLYSDLGADATFYLEQGLTVNTSYYRQVEAHNEAGAITSSGAAVFTFANVPSSTTVTDVSSDIITVEWSANGNPAGTDYCVEWSTGIDFSVLASSITQSLNYSITDLLSGATYYVRVCAINGNGFTTDYDIPTVIETIFSVPAAPSGFDGAAQSATSILWTWADNAVNESGYYLRKDSSTVVKTLSADTTFYLEISSVNTECYRYIEAYNSQGSAFSPAVPVYTFASLPSALGLTAVSSVTINVTWSANGNPSWTDYEIEWSTSVDFSVYDYDSSTGVSYEIMGNLTPDTTYYVKVAAENGDGFMTSFAGPKIMRTLDMEAPSAVINLSAETLDLKGAVKLSWTNPGDDGTVGTIKGGSQIIRYTRPDENPPSVEIKKDITPGTTEEITLTGLSYGEVYSFYVTVKDESGNVSAEISVSTSAGAQPKIEVYGITSPITAGVASDITIEIKNALRARVTDYTGTVEFASEILDGSDATSEAASSLPDEYTFTTADAGRHTFTGEVVFLNKNEVYTCYVLATDKDDSDITGRQTVTVSPPDFISGIVMQKDGRPLTGFYVEAYIMGLATGTSYTTINGSYTIMKLGVGTYTVRATAPGLDGLESLAEKETVNGTAEFIFTLEINYDLAEVQGVIAGLNPAMTASSLRAAGTIMPSEVPSYAFIELRSGKRVMKMAVGADGRFRIQNLIPGRYTARAWNGEQYSNPTLLNVGDGQVLTVNFTFPFKAAVYCWPNPANNKVNICYIGNPSYAAEVKIYTLTGEKVRTGREFVDFTNTDNETGKKFIWNLWNDARQEVASGVYFYILNLRDITSGEKKQYKGKIGVVR